MKTELCWFVLGICALLSQIGGTWWKGARRYLIPALLALTFWIFVGPRVSLILYVLLQFAAFTLPITLKGDSIPGEAINWAWLPVLGVLQCASPLVLGFNVWPAALVLGLLLGLLYALSNIKPFDRWFQWKLVEAYSGLFPATVMCFVITKV
jgi:hypothetical protein